ncbi:hypothetical protein I317_03664 [Kwoniella heveanensis CBS 569]|uniref:Uncharacterized protein n=1 Tax=Kwoniella heveanensis BCC8398 TaxID=1296120 RepID=A0A1B9GIK6_9TREE|nr:hypothetical protein I316_07550 [Kwoniella heveanensis BCC8398]OCF42548.1 hypothetical protein I317_03664 [Kwoniella heveanensis CBS 569]
MGASSSKAARKLPTASSITRAAANANANANAQPASAPNGGNPTSSRPPHPAMPPPPQGEDADPMMEAPNYLEQGLGGETRTSDGKPNQVPGSKRPSTGDEDKGMARGGMGRVQFSGEKDDAITRDAMDPQFMNNLSRLGQVRIHDAGEFVPAQAQRTLLSRVPEYINPSPAPPANHLTIPLLVSLLDRLKSLPSTSATDVASLYKEYGVDKSVMDDVRKWVNSVSVAESDEVRVEDGEEVREMKAVWVGGLAK